VGEGERCDAKIQNGTISQSVFRRQDKPNFATKRAIKRLNRGFQAGKDFMIDFNSNNNREINVNNGDESIRIVRPLLQ
jgi:hypothetical protein